MARRRSVQAEKVCAFVLTAIEPEYLAVAGHLGPGRERRTADGAVRDRPLSRRARRADGRRATGRSWGRVGGGAPAERPVARLRPSVLLLVGVAGGRKDARLGDVVVADTVHGHESGRDERDAFRPRIRSWPSAFALAQRARAGPGRVRGCVRTTGVPAFTVARFAGVAKDDRPVGTGQPAAPEGQFRNPSPRRRPPPPDSPASDTAAPPGPPRRPPHGVRPGWSGWCPGRRPRRGR
ncbi:hypothetical protein FB157_130135 [Streptomyces sp. BK340]|nr:hypothetical protein FB157_130135 [Streptomyces sp. BK340]